ncbi:MAG: nucleotidyltransferase family protein [Anaerocolumna sp.]
MIIEEEALLYLLNRAITKEKSNIIPNLNINWNQVFQMACRNKVAPLLFDQLTQINQQQPIEDSLFESWRQRALQCTLREYRKNYALKSLLELAKEKDIMLTVFKGPILANLYPNYALRPSSDTDILIQKEDTAILFQILEQLEYERKEKSEKNVYTYVNHRYGHILELHTTLYGEHTGPKIDRLMEMNLASRESLQEIVACGTKLTTLGFTEQLIYLMFHMIKHFMLEGITIRHLLDIVIYINAYIDIIDRKQFWSGMRELSYESCCTAFFSIGIKYLGLTNIIMEEEKLCESAVVENLLMDIIGAGETNHTEKKSFQIWGMMQPYLVGSMNKRQTTKSNYMYFFKPDRKEYAYARKYKILLPIYWIHKFVVYIKKGYLFDKRIYSPLEKVKKAENRLDLFEEIGLLYKGD